MTNLETLTIRSSYHYGPGLGEGCFSGFSKLREVSLYNVGQIGAGCFSNCPALQDVLIDFGFCTESFYSIFIGTSAFEGCSELLNITIRFNGWYSSQYASTFRIASKAFSNCGKLETVTIDYSQGEEPEYQPQGSSDMLYGSDSCLILVPSEYLDVYKSMEVWSDFADRIFPIE